MLAAVATEIDMLKISPLWVEFMAIANLALLLFLLWSLVIWTGRRAMKIPAEPRKVRTLPQKIFWVFVGFTLTWDAAWIVLFAPWNVCLMRVE
jgi:hypothetical protein